MQKYRFEQDQARYLFTQSGKRQILASYLRKNPLQVSFAQNEHGKPSLEDLEFNISHTKGMSVLAVATDQAVGIDIEAMAHQQELASLARHIMTDVEWAAYETSAEGEKLRTFYRLWTAKEAYLKNLGLGFVIEPNEVETDFPRLSAIKSEKGPTRVLHDHSCGDEFVIHLATEFAAKKVTFFDY